VCESTYGGREREALDPAGRRARFAEEVGAALADEGLLLIPSFAVERTQELLADLFALMDAGEIPSVPVFLDSPLAIRATEVFAEHADELEPGARAEAAFDHPNLRFSETVDDSKAIARFASGAIILAASGMCDAGRIRHHLKRCLWRENATVMLTGFQAPGTLGRLLEEGAKSVRIFGEPVAVRARIRSIDLYSGHADGTELVDWIRARAPIGRKLFLTHGDAAAIDALKADLAAAGLDGDAIATPHLDDEFDLVEGEFRPREAVIRRMPEDGIDRLDWHNALAALTLDLRARLDAAPDDAARERILAELRETLERSASG
jgi:metallo-beta-lactamase family protein